MAEPSEGAPPLLNSHTLPIQCSQRQGFCGNLAYIEHNTEHPDTLQPLLTHKQAPHEHAQLVCSWMPLGLGWEGLSHCQQAETTGPPVLAKVTASQGPSVLHHQPVLCRMLEVLAQHKTLAPPDRTPEPRLPPATPPPYQGDESQAGLCLMLPLVSCYSFLPWVRDQAREPSLCGSLSAPCQCPALFRWALAGA